MPEGADKLVKNLAETPPGWRRVEAAGFRVHADELADKCMAFAEAVAEGLEQEPRILPYRFLYDRAGSEIYERITEQPEYYPMRTEDAILQRCSAAIRERVGDTTLVEFGSGSSSKTRRLLDAWTSAGAARYVPIDISLSALEAACAQLGWEYPELQLEAIRASYERAMPLVRQLSPVTFVFLGSSVGNFDSAELDEFLEMVSRHLSPGDAFLLGIDLVKNHAELEAAYNDEAGWSARFTLNLFARMNRELGTRIPMDAIEHVAYYNDRLDRIEIYARFNREVMIELDQIDRRFRVARGEMIRTEISRKFHADEMTANVARFGLVHDATYADDEERFALLLLRRSAPAPEAENQVAGAEGLLRSVRSRTLEIISPLSEAELAAQPESIMSPLLWDLGHIAEFERLWLVQRVIDAQGKAGDERSGLHATFDPDEHPRAERGRLDLPTRATTERRLEDVRTQALEVLRSGAIDPTVALTREGYVYRMVAQHETQHQATMLQAIQMHATLRFEPPFGGPPPRRPDYQPTNEMVLVPAGHCEIGTDDRSIAYDNERPRHHVELPAFRIDVAPVTNLEFQRFIEDDGYARCELWSEAGWAWCRGEAAEAPGYWRRRGAEWERRCFGAWRPVDPSRPVVHVSWFEADAYARWAGKRLPTEFEWEKVAAWDPSRREARPYPWGYRRPTGEHANLGQRVLEPVAVGTYPRGRSFYGCHQMLGDVYEWTASDFLPYPGFEPFPYREYSEAFFGHRYKVLRGASWAVPAFMARNTYRNWDLPQRRQIFAGIRCAADV